MTKTIQSIRGVHDILPEQSIHWQYVEAIFRDLMSDYGYKEVRMPILESTDLFIRSIGEVTDIVEKEMYTFTDRNDSKLTLRPEGTAGCVRAGIQHGLLYNQQQRLWYTGPMFRRERPQKGRYRQFHQFGVETFGMTGPDIDAELIALTARLWQRLNLTNITLELNSIGNTASRERYKECLIEYFNQHSEILDEDSQRRLTSNPLRILDSKNPAMQEMIGQAPNILDYLDEESSTHFEQLKALLDSMQISYIINPRLVRGLDYYSNTVFEWTTTQLGSQGTVCGGGRYDKLVEHLGSRETPACGFGLGIERLLGLLEAQDLQPPEETPHFYFIMHGDKAQLAGMQLAEMMRDSLSGIKIICNCGGGSFKAQMKRADKSSAAFALILADTEVENGQISVKPLQSRNEQKLIPQTELKEYIESLNLL